MDEDYLRVADVMTAGVETIDADESIQKAAEQMKARSGDGAESLARNRVMPTPTETRRSGGAWSLGRKYRGGAWSLRERTARHPTGRFPRRPQLKSPVRDGNRCHSGRDARRHPPC